MSAEPYDTLNLARNLADRPAAVAENHRRLAAEVGYDIDALYEVSQVHGNIVQGADPGAPVAAFREREGDAVWSLKRDQAVAVRVADCVPILIASPETGAVAAVHAGWRGVVAQVIANSITALCEAANVKARSLLVAVGPHISCEAFEVSPEIAQQLAACAGGEPTVIMPREPRPHVDLCRLVRAQLEAAGVVTEQIDFVTGCTFQDRARFFSFRRDGQASGRHLAVIVAGC